MTYNAQTEQGLLIDTELLFRALERVGISKKTLKRKSKQRGDFSVGDQDSANYAHVMFDTDGCGIYGKKTNCPFRFSVWPVKNQEGVVRVTGYPSAKELFQHIGAHNLIPLIEAATEAPTSPTLPTAE
jgi:hypothetical protein